MTKAVTIYHNNILAGPAAHPVEQHYDLWLRDQAAYEEITAEEREMLADADEHLIKHASEYLEVLEEDGWFDLPALREKEGVTPDRWWWFLDLFAQNPNLRPPLVNAV